MIAVIVQARMGSTRLPGKVLREIAGRPMLSYQVGRLRRVRRTDRIVLAIPDDPANEPLERFCASEQVPCVRGPEQDVLARYVLAARECDATVVVRVTSDCPLIDPSLVDLAIDTLTNSDPRPDYVSNMLQPTWPYGMAVEAFTRAALEAANTEARDPAEREHVTPFIYWRRDRFRVQSLTRAPDLSALRWTVDTREDFALVSRLLERLYPANPQFDIDDILALLGQHPDWSDINKHIQQRAVSASEAKQ
jgi:spore coat polysaccharide biosynthesis protein SpsF